MIHCARVTRVVMKLHKARASGQGAHFEKSTQHCEAWTTGCKTVLLRLDPVGHIHITFSGIKSRLGTGTTRVKLRSSINQTLLQFSILRLYEHDGQLFRGPCAPSARVDADRRRANGTQGACAMPSSRLPTFSSLGTLNERRQSSIS